MRLIDAIFLGIVQGLTEFLPVSSSGHLVLIQKLLPSFSQSGVVFDVILHMGTLLAVMIYFRKKIFTMSVKYLSLLIVGGIPAAVFGFAFRKYLESTYSVGGIFLSLQFLFTAALCFFTDRLRGTRNELKISDSFIVGIAQALAIFPAISRSGSTIFAAVRRGVQKEAAAEFSFILSIPAILGANVLEIGAYKNEVFSIPEEYLIGFLSALLVGLLSIKLTLSLLSRNKFRIFAVYTLLLAGLSLFV